MAKRSELQAGQEWAYSRTREHNFFRFHEKVVILSTEPYEQSHWSYSSEPRKTSKGSGVLVKLGNLETVVQLSTLWMPWFDYVIDKAEHDKQWQATMEANAIARAEARKFQKEIYQPALRELQQAMEGAGLDGISAFYDMESSFKLETIQFLTEAIKEKVARDNFEAYLAQGAREDARWDAENYA